MTTTRITTALLLAAGLIAAGCGGGPKEDDGVPSLGAGDAEQEDTDGSGEDPDAELMDWVECMRDEGIALEDPVRDEDGNVEITGPGIHIGGGPSGPPGAAEDGAPPFEGGEAEDPGEGDDSGRDRETMEAASEACGGPPPIANEERGPVDEEAMQQQMLEFAQCMRDEGVADFPDPDFSESGPGGIAVERESETDAADGSGPSERVTIGPFGEIDMGDPTTKAAFEACEPTLHAPAEDAESGNGAT